MLLGVVIRGCDMPSIDISQQIIHTIIMAKCQFYYVISYGRVRVVRENIRMRKLASCMRLAASEATIYKPLQEPL